MASLLLYIIKNTWQAFYFILLRINDIVEKTT